MNNSSNILFKYGLVKDEYIELPPKKIERIFITSTSEGNGFANNMKYINETFDNSKLFVLADGFIYDKNIFGIDVNNVYYDPKFSFWWHWKHIWHNQNGDLPAFLDWHTGDVEKLFCYEKTRKYKFLSLNHNSKFGRNIFIEGLSDDFIKENWISAHFSKRDNLKNDKYYGERYAHDNRFFNIIFTKLNDKAYIHPFFESSVINDAITDKHLCITEKSSIPFLCGAIAIPLSSMFYVSEYEKLGFKFVKEINGIPINETIEWKVDFEEWNKNIPKDSPEVEWLQKQVTKIETINKENSLSDIREVYLQNLEIIEHNQNIVRGLMTNDLYLNNLKEWMK